MAAKPSARQGPKWGSAKTAAISWITGTGTGRGRRPFHSSEVGRGVKSHQPIHSTRRGRGRAWVIASRQARLAWVASTITG
jgi:hypothetical protein